MYATLSAFVLHGFRRAWSYKVNFASRYLTVVVSVLFYLVLDRLFKGASVNSVDGGTYFAFLLVGGSFLRYLDEGMRAFAENLHEELVMGTIEPLLATATPNYLALLGPSAWMLIDGALLVFFQLIVGVIFGADLSHANWLSAIVVVLFSLLTIVCWGVLSAAFTIVFKRTDPINWLVSAIAYVFAGVFFPVNVLPPALQVVSYLLPFTYTLHGLRATLLRGATLADVAPDILALLVFTVVLLPLAMWALRKAIVYLKQTGELAHY